MLHNLNNKLKKSRKIFIRVSSVYLSYDKYISSRVM